MRKAINMAALLTFIWLVLDTLHIPDMLMNFLLAGQLPFSNLSLSPSLMLTLLVAVAGVVAIEMSIRRFTLARRARTLLVKRERAPKRNLKRI